MSEKRSSNESSNEIKGTLTPGVLPELLRNLYVGRKTGMLHFTRGEERGSVCFISGQIVYGGANIKECLMGETFVRHGLVTPAELAQALEAAALTGKRLGEALLALGILDEEAHQDALALHVREILLCVFSWTAGTYAFEERGPEAFRGSDQPLRLTTAEVILDAVWSVHDPEVVRRAVGDLDRVLVLPTDPLLRLQRVTLTPTDGFMLSRVDGTFTAREILKIAPVDRDEAERSLFGLLCIGMVEYACAPSPKEEAASSQALRRAVLEAHAALATRDHFEVLGVPRSATEAEVRAAYLRLTKVFHPDAHHDRALTDLRDKLEAVFTRLNEAHRVLSDPQGRASYESTRLAARSTPRPAAEAPPVPSPSPDRAIERQSVEEALARADETFAAGRYWDALQIADGVLPMAKGKLRQRARILKAKAYLKDARWRKVAEEELRAAVQEDRSNADAYYLLGSLYKAEGAQDWAKAMFRKVLALQPRHAGALAELGPEPTEGRPRGGLLKRLLTRS